MPLWFTCDKAKRRPLHFPLSASKCWAGRPGHADSGAEGSPAGPARRAAGLRATPRHQPTARPHSGERRALGSNPFFHPLPHTRRPSASAACLRTRKALPYHVLEPWVVAGPENGLASALAPILSNSLSYYVQISLGFAYWTVLWLQFNFNGHNMISWLKFPLKWKFRNIFGASMTIR